MKTVVVLAFACAASLCACGSGRTVRAIATASPGPVATGSRAPAARPVVATAPPARATGGRGIEHASTPVQSSDPSTDPHPIPTREVAVVSTAMVMPTATLTPTATPVPLPSGVPWADSDAPPQIVRFEMSSTVVHPGDVLSGSVTASSNVASVEIRVAGYSYVMTKTEPGKFVLSVTVPSVPRIFRRTYPLVAIARNTRGDATQRETQLTIR
jgi:hypothetical protein